MKTYSVEIKYYTYDGAENSTTLEIEAASAEEAKRTAEEI